MRLAALLIFSAPIGLQGQSPDAGVRAATERILPKLIEVRHDLHRHPELGNRETRTATVVARELKRLGLEVRTGVAKTGVVGVLRGGRPGRVVGVRADMDALPVTEQTDLSFKSVETTTYLGRETGVSHACGHDIHVAVALGVAEVLSGLRSRLPGTVVWYFQPAEEGPPPGEEGGAKLMIAEGVLRDPKPEVILALHANGDPPDEAGEWERVGRISYTPGPQYAAATRWRARVIGRQAHGATPHLGIDAIVIASQIVSGLQTIRSRTLSPFEPAVVTVGVFQAGDRNNIIAGEAHLEGTVRTFNDSTTSLIKSRMRQIFAGESAAGSARFELTFDDATPVTVNDTALARRFHPVLERVVGAENVGIVPPETGAEDFSFFAREVPSFYFKLGAVLSGNTSGGHHTPTFRADDEAIPVGVRAMTAVVLEALATGR
jgi:amidohydrolase